MSFIEVLKFAVEEGLPRMIRVKGKWMALGGRVYNEVLNYKK